MGMGLAKGTHSLATFPPSLWSFEADLQYHQTLLLNPPSYFKCADLKTKATPPSFGSVTARCLIVEIAMGIEVGEEGQVAIKPTSLQVLSVSVFHGFCLLFEKGSHIDWTGFKVNA